MTNSRQIFCRMIRSSAILRNDQVSLHGAYLVSTPLVVLVSIVSSQDLQSSLKKIKREHVNTLKFYATRGSLRQHLNLNPHKIDLDAHIHHINPSKHKVLIKNLAILLFLFIRDEFLFDGYFFEI